MKNTIDLLQQVEAIAAAKGSLLAEILDAAAKGLSVDEPSAVEPGDQPIGEMNQLERAIHFLYRKYAREAEDLLGDMQACYNKPSDVSIRVMSKLNSHVNRSRAAYDLMMDAIQTRFGTQETSLYTGWRIRANGQIILCVEEVEDYPLSLITNALAKIPGVQVTLAKNAPDSRSVN